MLASCLWNAERTASGLIFLKAPSISKKTDKVYPFLQRFSLSEIRLSKAVSTTFPFFKCVLGAESVDTTIVLRWVSNMRSSDFSKKHVRLTKMEKSLEYVQSASGAEPSGTHWAFSFFFKIVNLRS